MIISMTMVACEAIKIQADINQLKEMYEYARPAMGIIFHEKRHGAHPTSSFQEVLFTIKHPDLRKFTEVGEIKICVHPWEERKANIERQNPWDNKKAKAERKIHESIRQMWRERTFSFACNRAEKDINDRMRVYNDRLIAINNVTEGVKQLLRRATVKSLPNSGRSKKSALTWVGRTIGGWFGLASREDVLGLTNYIKKLQGTSTEIGQQFQETKEFLGKMVETNNNRFKTLTESIGKVANKVNDIIEDNVEFRGTINTYMKSLEEENVYTRAFLLEVANIAYRTEAMVQDSAVYLEALTDWFDALLKLQQNLLPKYIVPPAVLIKELRDLDYETKSSGSGIMLLHEPEDLFYYYGNEIVTFLSYEADIYIYMKVPVGNTDFILDIYEAEIYNVPVNAKGEEDEDKTGYTKVISEKQILAVTRSRSMYIELTTQEYSACERSLHFSCPKLEVLRDRRADSCLMAIFAERYAVANRECDIRYFPDDPPSEIIPVGGATYIIIKPVREIMVQCGTDKAIMAPKRAVLIQVPCGCSLATGPLNVPLVMSNCEYRRKAIVGHLLNLAQLMAYNLSISHIPGPQNALYNTTPRVNVPRLSLLEGYGKLTEEDRRRGLALKTAVQKIIETEVHVREPGELMNAWTMFTNMPWEFASIIGIDGAWNFMLTIGMIVVGYKLRCLAITVTLMGKALLEKAEARVIGSVESQTPVPGLLGQAVTKSAGCPRSGLEAIMTFFVMVTILILALMIPQAYTTMKSLKERYWYKCSGCYCVINLVAIVNNRSVSIPIQQIPYPFFAIGMTCIPKPLLRGVVRISPWRYRMRLDWSAPLRIMAYGENLAISLDTSVEMGGTVGSLVLKYWVKKSRPISVLTCRMSSGCKCDIMNTKYVCMPARQEVIHECAAGKRDIDRTDRGNKRMRSELNGDESRGPMIKEGEIVVRTKGYKSIEHRGDVGIMELRGDREQYGEMRSKGEGRQGTSKKQSRLVDEYEMDEVVGKHRHRGHPLDPGRH